MSAKICHISTVHDRFDVRIFRKELKSLSGNYESVFIVADGKGDQWVEGIKVFDIGKRKSSRIKRFYQDSKKALNKARELDCELYHFHDPELIPIAIRLKRKTGKKVIFDAHEDLPKQLKSKPYLHPIVRKALSTAFSLFEKMYSYRFDAIVTATSSIRQKFLRLNSNSFSINNYPIISEFWQEPDWDKKQDEICYAGGISIIRGTEYVIKAMPLAGEVKLNLAGEFTDLKLKSRLQNEIGWKQVNEFGFVSRESLKDIFARSKAGLVTFLPLPNHLDAQPNKIFEYMSAGIPVIASDFPLWREVVEGNGCGICVNPESPKAIAKAIRFITENPNQAKEFAMNGLEAIREKYNWQAEQEKLFKVYEQVLEGKAKKA